MDRTRNLEWSRQTPPTIPGDGDGQLDVSSIGRTNGHHSEEEQLYIRNVLLAAESLLQSGSVDRDLGRREETVDLIGRCKIALAPHKRLPSDVLRSILRFCGEAPVRFPLGSKPGGIDQDLRLLHITHVCSAWRQLALEMPALWSDIYIYLTWGGHNKTLSAAKQWFDRAQDMRRALFVDFDVGERSPHLNVLWEQLLEFMAQYRLENLELTYPINHVALKLPDHVWPSIERLYLRHEGHGSSRGWQQLFSNFGKLSNLRLLNIFGSYHLHGMDQIVPWHQLRMLQLGALGEGPITPSSCLNVLRQSRLLECCRITLSEESSFTSTVISTKEKIVLANMDHFEVQFRDGLTVSSFLKPLVMSNITTFILKRAPTRGVSPELNCDMSTLFDIIQRSGGMRRIRHLKIDTSVMLDIGVLLELLPSLDTISIKSGHFSDNTIKRLSSGKLGPRLCNISLDVRQHDDVDQILSMVESRYHHATQSPDSEQIEDSTPCPFKYIVIATDEKWLSRYRNRVELLSKKCDASIRLLIYFY